MFSGIIEALAPILSSESMNQALRIEVAKPNDFDDIKPGDSIATNGVCLTSEPTYKSDRLVFTLGAETLKVLKISDSGSFQRNFKSPVNLERSMRLGDRIHGHLVSGHVDRLVRIADSKALGDSWWMRLETEVDGSSYLWPKGSVTLNGVSLTVNHLERAAEKLFFEVTLIPETIQRTNLPLFSAGEYLNLEWDWMAKGLFHMLKERPQ